MRVLTYTLVSDGTSDATLTSVINWLMDSCWPEIAYKPQFARALPPARDGLQLRLRAALHNYPCDLLVIHRDAERESHAQRLSEIEAETAQLTHRLTVPVIPVRMTEAWLLSSVSAIREAAGNPNGREPLELPTARRWESLADPKAILFTALRNASNSSGRKLQQFSVTERRYRVAENTQDYSPLRQLAAFNHFENRLNDAVTRWQQQTPVSP